MTRPTLWALGTLATAALSTTLAGERLAPMFGVTDPPAAAAPRPTLAAAPVPTVSADLAGHFVVHPQLDGRRLRMLVDTGARLVALSHEDAVLAGIKVERRDFNRLVSTANGLVEVAPIRIREMRVGDIVVRDVQGVVLPPGRLAGSLLGMSFLRRLKRFEIGAGGLTLRG